MPLIVERLRIARESRGLSQTALSALCGLAHNMVYRYESGRADPTSTTLALLAQHLQVSSDYLLGLSDEPRELLNVSDLRPEEREALTVLRREGWYGLLRLVTEQLGKTHRSDGT